MSELQAELDRIKASVPVTGWYCPCCMRGVRPIEVTYEENHTECGARVVEAEDGIVLRLVAALSLTIEQRDLAVTTLLKRDPDLPEVIAAQDAKILEVLRGEE